MPGIGINLCIQGYRLVLRYLRFIPVLPVLQLNDGATGIVARLEQTRQ
jgi:hypothetical protein